jgi:hypothetical protein
VTRRAVLAIAAVVGILAGLALVQGADARGLELEPPAAITGARG